MLEVVTVNTFRFPVTTLVLPFTLASIGYITDWLTCFIGTGGVNPECGAGTAARLSDGTVLPFEKILRNVLLPVFLTVEWGWLETGHNCLAPTDRGIDERDAEGIWSLDGKTERLPSSSIIGRLREVSCVKSMVKAGALVQKSVIYCRAAGIRGIKELR